MSKAIDSFSQPIKLQPKTYIQHYHEEDHEQCKEYQESLLAQIRELQEVNKFLFDQNQGLKVVKDYEISLLMQENEMIKRNEKKRMLHAFNQFLNTIPNIDTSPDDFVEQHFQYTQPSYNLEASSRVDHLYQPKSDYEFHNEETLPTQSHVHNKRSTM